MRRSSLLLLLLACAACAPVVPVIPPSVATLPPGAFPDGPDQDLAAITLGANDFQDAARTYGRPAEGARAAAALDYLAGTVAVAPRWQCASPGVRALLPDARAALRAQLGVPASASSQSVVDGLLRVADALRDNDQAAARQALAPPAFPDPAGTLAALGRLPYVNAADVALQEMEAEVNQSMPGSTCFGGA